MPPKRAAKKETGNVSRAPQENLTDLKKNKVAPEDVQDVSPNLRTWSSSLAPQGFDPNHAMCTQRRGRRSGSIVMYRGADAVICRL